MNLVNLVNDVHKDSELSEHRGNRRSGRGNRTARGTGQGNGTRTTGRNVGRTRFKGSTEEMNGNVFECYEEQSDRRQFAKTLEALESYVKTKLAFSEDLAPLFGMEISEPTIEKPDDPGPNPTETDKLIWQEEVKEYVKRNRTLKGNLANVHAVIWSQSSEAMRSKVKALVEYEQRAKANDCTWMLQQIKATTMQFDAKRNPFLSLLDARARFLSCKQEQHQSADEYLERLKGFADTIEYHGGTIAESHTLIPEQTDEGTMRDENTRKAMARDRTLAVALIRGADPTRYGTLIADLSNQFAMGINNYPSDITSAYSLLVNYKTPSNARVRNADHNNNGATNNNGTTTTTSTSNQTPAAEASAMTFTQDGANASTVEGASDNRNNLAANTGTTLLQHALMLAQVKPHSIDPDWILLDSQSTISVFNNPTMLSNIRKSEHVLRAMTNGGYQDSHMVGDFANLGTVWFNSESIANILSLADVTKVCRVTMDSGKEASISVHRKDGSVMKFVEHPSGLYVFDSKSKALGDTTTAYTMVTTVAQQRKLFSPREVSSADVARDLYRKIGRPDEAEFQKILRQNLIRNCPVTPDDARRALLIYGPDIAAIKGKTTRSSASKRVPTFEAIPIPPPILKHHRKVTLCIDFFFVQGHGFLHTVSRNIGFRTVRHVPDRKQSTILDEVKNVTKLYTDRGFVICDVHGDHEFECIRDQLRPIEVNVVPRDSHVGEVERSIRTIKERLRACVHGLPYKRLPKEIITSMVTDVVRLLNQFPWKNGISDTLSPSAIVTGAPLPDYNSLCLEFGSYVQTFEDNSPSNTIKARSLGAIVLNPTGNAQGDYYFLSLATGARISRHQYTPLPLTDVAIARVEALAYNEGQPLIQASGLVVEWSVDQTIDDDAYDFDYDPPEDDPDDDVLPEDLDPVERDELRDLGADQGQVEEPGIVPVQETPATTQNNQEIEQELDETWEEENDAVFDIDTDNENEDNVEMNRALGHEEGENQGAC